MKDRVGEKHITNEGYEVEIVKFVNYHDCDIIFPCGLKKTNMQYGGVKGGRLKYPYHPSVFCKGYFGIGKFHQVKGGKRSTTYNFWKNIIERCYSKKSISYKTYGGKGVVVCEEWLDFQNFGKWFEENYSPEIMQGFQIDKDILVKGNKIYSPETCCFVPSEINSLFINCKATRGDLPIGVIKHKKVFRARISKNKKYTHIGLYNTPEKAFKAYKEAKEDYIKEVADKWRGKITEEVYQAMYNYQVEIID